MNTISVIIPTLGRVEEVDALLNSLAGGTRVPDEVVIIDQNDEKVLAGVEAKYRNKLNLRREIVSFKGLSRAKNEGVRLATGDFILIPDDDCRVFVDTIETALNTILNKQADVVFGKCIDESGADSVLVFRSTEGWLSFSQLTGMFVEATMICRRSVFEDEMYDESMGVGCFHGADEGYDWVLRLLKRNKRLFYTPLLRFYHPQAFLEHSSQKAVRRAFYYRAGYAKRCRKHNQMRSYLSRIVKVVPMIFFCLMFRRNKVKYYLAEMGGLLAGYAIE